MMSTVDPNPKTRQAQSYGRRPQRWGGMTGGATGTMTTGGVDRSAVGAGGATATAANAWRGVDPTSAWTGQSARADLERRMGRALTEDEVAAGRRLTGYDDATGAGAMTGAQYNTLLREGSRLAGGTYEDYTAEGGGGRTAPIWDTEDAPDYEGREYERGPRYQGETFRAPTAAEMEADPGYQARIKAGQRALEQGASARGMLRGTNTIRGVTDYAQEAASQEYQNVYGRARDAHQINQGERRYGFEADQGEGRYAHEQGVSRDQLRYAPRLMSWQNREQAKQRQGELGMDDRWRRETYNRDDAWRRYTYGTDDEYRRWLENNQNRRFLVSAGNN